VLLADFELAGMVSRGAPAGEVVQVAVSKGRKNTLFADGLAKVLEGSTTMEEVLRVLRPRE